MVKVSEVVAFRAMLVGLNALAIEGGATTVRVAVLLVAPVPPSVELTAPVVLAFAPAVLPVTFTENVQELFTAIVPPLRLMLPEPAVAVMVPVPQVPVMPFGVETTTPAGKVSLNATPVSATVFVAGLVMVKLNALVPFSGMLVGLNALAIVGGPTTATLALAVLPVPPFVELTVTLLFLTPAVVPCTLTVIVQLAPAATVPPLKLTEEAPAVPVAVPPQLLVRPGAGATTKPAGKLSVNARPFNAEFTFEFVMVKVRLVVPFSGIVAAPKAFAMLGGLITVSVAEEVESAFVPAVVELMVTVLL